MKTEAGDRMERLQALILLQSMKGATKAQKAVELNIAGFTAVEIANILDTRAAIVHQYLNLARKKKPK